MGMDEITSSYLSSASHFASTHDSQIFIRLAQAYQTLSDHESRLQYDTALIDGQQYKKSEEDAMSIDEAMQIYENAKKEYQYHHHSIKSKFQHAVQSLISNSSHGIDDRHAHRGHVQHGQVDDMPSFPMVKLSRAYRTESSRSNHKIVRQWKMQNHN